MASQNVSNDVKTSLGPVGLDRMLDDIIGDITITNDGVNILRMLGVEHPAATVTACQAASNNVKTSIGPVGLDRMLDDIIGDITITNDGVNILRMLGVEHPAATVTACQAASNNVKTSIGPVGLDRMLMDDIIGDITITNDCVNILRMLGVEHPATKNRPEKGCEDKCLSKLKRLKNRLKSRRFTQKY